MNPFQPSLVQSIDRMGNCIGQKSRLRNKHHRYSSTHNEQGTTPTQLLPSTQTTIHSSRTDLIQFNDQNKFQSNNTEKDNVEQSISTMGFLFSKEKDQEVPSLTSEIKSESPSPSLSDASYSSFSCNSTSFSSEDQLILSSSSSSYSDQPYLPNQSSRFPTSLSPCHKDLFHQKTISHHYQTLRSIIDDVIQQEFIRIHRQTKTILIEHEQFQCTQLTDINPSDTPSFIFDDDRKLIHVTKYAQWQDLQSITYNRKDISPGFSSCNDCSMLLSGAKLNQYLRSFIIANTTYGLIQMCFGEFDKKSNLYGYISSVDSNRIRQTIINNSKLNYSYDLDVDYTDIYFVLRVNSWPKKIRSIYQQRTRLWPTNIDHLFNRTCFLRYEGKKYETSTNTQCSTCEQVLSTFSHSSWSYAYAAIEEQLVRLMSDGQRRFASIVWNYLNSKTQGQLSFDIFKHLLFYFFEQYPSDAFLTSDFVSQISCFLNFLLDHLQRKSIPHYFNVNYNLFNEKISIDLIPRQITSLDLRNSFIYNLPKSSMYLYQLMYLIQFQTNFLQDFPCSKINLTQTILEIHELVLQQFSSGIQTYKQQFDCSKALELHCPLTLDCLYRYQEENVQIILDYLPLLRIKEPSLLLHSFWSIFIQYLNFLFNDLFIS